MKLNRSIGEKELMLERRPAKNDNLLGSPGKKLKLNMNKAKSFKHNHHQNDLSNDVTVNWPAKELEVSEPSKVSNKHPSTNRMDSTSKENSPMKKSKVKIRRKCCNGRGGCSGEVPPTQIKIVMPDLTHLNSHPINVAIRNINRFIHMAFKIKSKDDYDTPAIISLGRQLGIIYPKTQIVDHNFLRSREFLSFSKEKILRYLYNAINKSNGNIEPDNSKTIAPFHQNRFYIGKGNNYMLVKSVIKQRWWWSMNEKENFGNVNFLWTQWRKNKHLALLDTVKECTNKNMIELK